MRASIHIPEGLHSFHIKPAPPVLTSKSKPVTILLKRVVADLRKWLNCSWAVGMIPEGKDRVPELSVVCVEGDARRDEVPDLICPIPDKRGAGLTAIIAAGPRRDGTPYSDEDHRFADALCEHMGGLLGNERLARNISEELTRAEESREDAEIARGIYDRLDHCPQERIPGLEYGAQCHRAGKAGGDFFELLTREDHNLVVAIGNVAVRGLSGGIMLGGALASVRALVARGESLVQIAAELNRTLWDMSPEGTFTSFLCAQIDPARKFLRYVNAGHEPALLVRSGSNRVDRLDTTGAVLALSRGSSYRERVALFEPGDMLAAFTDGIAESAGPDGVVRILREQPDCGVQDLAAYVVALGGAAADRTIVLVRSVNAQACPLPMEKYQLVAA